MTNIHVDTSNITTLKLCCVSRCDDMVRNVWRAMFCNPTIFFYHRMLLIYILFWNSTIFFYHRMLLIGYLKRHSSQRWQYMLRNTLTVLSFNDHFDCLTCKTYFRHQNRYSTRGHTLGMVLYTTLSCFDI